MKRDPSFVRPTRALARLTASGVTFVACALTFAPAAIGATNVNVTSTSSGIGPSGCTLQEAVAALNAGVSQNGCTLTGTGAPRTVILQAGTYNISNRLAPTVTMTIRGPAADSMGTTFIQPTSGFTANAAVFLQTTGTTSHHFTLQDLTIRRTSGTASVSGVRVEAYWNPADIAPDGGPVVQLTRVRVTGFNNSGVYSNYAIVNVTQSIIENNSSPQDGGGIRLFADGLSNRSLVMTRSLVRDNSATWSGGGIYFYGSGGSRIEHTTVAQNSAHSGGGLFLQLSTIGYMDADYNTIAENDAFSGGGIYCNGCDSRVRTYASIIANNTAAEGFDLDGFVDSEYCIWSETDYRDEANHGEGDMVDVDPLLGPLLDLGGIVADLDGDGVRDGMKGYQPLKGSPALDRAATATQHPRDQRGFPRGRDAHGGNASDLNDLGAVENGPFETERLSVQQVSAGDQHFSLLESSFSDLAGTHFKANAVNDFVVYRLPVSQSGGYNVKVRVRKTPASAQARLQWASSPAGPWNNIGMAQELYSSTFSYVEIDVSPNVSLTSGLRYFRWLITGKNAASTAWEVATDYIKLIKL